MKRLAAFVLAAGLSGGAPDLTFFELFTLTAMVAFRNARVEVAVLETGMGGRLDSTNVVTPLVCVITEIGLDHMKQLGDTVREIAGEKAGIIKPGIPVVCGAQHPEAQRVIKQTARDNEAPLLVYGREYSVRGVTRTGRNLEFTGDGTMAVFDAPTRALRCAFELVAAARELGIEIRAGIHTGEVEHLSGGDLGGLAVHLAARVMAEAGAGEVLVSSTVRDLVVGSGIVFTPRGTRALKGIPGEWALLAVDA